MSELYNRSEKIDEMKTLIDKSIKLCGSQEALARRLKIKQQDIQQMKSGKRKISPATIGLLCNVLDIGREESRRLAVTAIVLNAKGHMQRELSKAFAV